MVRELASEELRKECDPRLMKCDTTEELSPLDEIIGQERAIRALRFGMNIKERGLNIFRGKHNQPQVDKRLREMAERLKEFPTTEEKKKKEEPS